MDKQTAIDLLDNLLGMVEDNHGSDYDKAIHMGIDALKMQLSIERTTFPVDGEPLDCISRQQTILAIERNAYRHTYVDQIVDIIKWLQSEQPEVIRCEDCKWRRNRNGTMAWIPCRALVTPDDFYCKYAERKEQ